MITDLIDRTRAQRLDCLRVARLLDGSDNRHPRREDAIRHARDAAVSLAAMVEALVMLADDAEPGAADGEHGHPDPSVATETPEATGWTSGLESSGSSEGTAGRAIATQAGDEGQRRGMDRRDHQNAPECEWEAR